MAKLRLGERPSICVIYNKRDRQSPYKMFDKHFLVTVPTIRHCNCL